ncbi:unnamed protein product [Cladocopium goreaui]|uniref:Uncharacterized protein n=1 Tax=Cladocopium goreaui TaxID=2562237 RepID=A0A9P1CED7_9DINO|nr:unnamed protein product [Cladocopium goreaui]
MLPLLSIAGGETCRQDTEYQPRPRASTAMRLRPGALLTFLALPVFLTFVLPRGDRSTLRPERQKHFTARQAEGSDAGVSAKGKTVAESLKKAEKADEKEMNIFETGALGIMGAAILLGGVLVVGVLGGEVLWIES